MLTESGVPDLIFSIEEALVLLGGKPFFENLTFHIHRGRKIALVGRNGAGKTTLMNIISGARELDDGKRWMHLGISIGHMRQQVTPAPGQSVRDFIFSGTNAGKEEWERTHKVEMIVLPLGLDPDAEMASLSGGMLRRAALAFALVEEPDILLLDEPTNHMDLEIIEWLENYLKAYKGAVLCVSHDRAFLAAVTDRVFWLDRGQLRVSPYGFARFEEWSQTLFDQEARELHNRGKKVEMELAWANRGVKARVKRNVRRVAEAKSASQALEADKISYRRATRKIVLEAPKAEESSLNVAEFINVGKSFGAKKILEKFSFKVRRRDRVGIIGRNGSGKTTLLRMLVGEIEPDAGKVKMAKELTFGYFDQKRALLDPDKTLQENLCSSGGEYLDVRGKQRHVCGYLKDFMFDPEDAWRKVSTLSGGQMNRLMLAKVLANPGSFLILDEPTNDLDMDTLDMLEAILQAYDGTLFVVSHDRDFMDQIVDKLVVFEGDGRVDVIVGGYSDYLDFKKSGGVVHEKAPTAPISVKKPSTAPVAASPPKSAPKMTFKLRHEHQELPARIAALESEIAALETAMADPDFYSRDAAGFQHTAKRLVLAREELESAETRWLELEALCEEAGG